MTTVGVIGLGLMGGSLLRRLAAVPAEESSVTAIGWDADPATRAAAGAEGLTVVSSVDDLAAASDTVFVAVPLPALSDVLTALAGAPRPPAVVSDLTSVKEPVRALSHGLTFVGGHPMAGTAESGFAASSVGLLAGASWVLTLDEETDLSAWLTVARLVTGLGCRVVPCTSAEHDRAVARVSHLPHVLAAALVLGAADDPLALTLAAGSFRDATRVAGTRAALVAAMCAGNAGALDAEIRALAARLDQARSLLTDGEALTGWFAGAERGRTGWPPSAGAESRLPIDGTLPARLLSTGRTGGHVVKVGPHDVSVQTAPPS